MVTQLAGPIFCLAGGLFRPWRCLKALPSPNWDSVKPAAFDGIALLAMRIAICSPVVWSQAPQLARLRGHEIVLPAVQFALLASSANGRWQLVADGGCLIFLLLARGRILSDHSGHSDWSAASPA